MNEAKTTSEAQGDSGRPVPESIRSIIVRILFAAMAFLFLYRLGTWFLASLFSPATDDLTLHAFRFENAIRHSVPIEKPWFISSGFITIVRFLRSLPFEYRTPALHLLDDALLIGFFIATVFWSRRVFSSSWPAVIGTTFIVGRLFETRFVELSDRDWYAAMFAFMGVLVAGAFESRRAAILGGTLWMISLQFRPQTVLLLPCLALARLSLFQNDRPGMRDVRKAIVDNAIGLAIGFVLVNVPLWLMGGFPAYYVDTFLFMKKGGHGGETNVALILRNFAALCTRQHDLSYVLMYPALIFLCAWCRARLVLWLLTAIFSLLATTVWASVNPVVLWYHEFPMFIAEAIALGTIVGCMLSLSPNRHEPVCMLGLAFGFSLAYWSNPVISVQGSVRETLAQLRNHDYSPISVSSKFAEFPPLIWEMDRKAKRDMYEFLKTTVDSETIPFEKIDIDNQTFPYHPFYLRNPGVVGDQMTWTNVVGELIAWHLKAKSDKGFLTFLDRLKSNSDGYLMWIPRQAKSDRIRFGNHDITEEMRKLFETIRTHYEPVARFGEVEFLRKKMAGTDTGP